jgi:acyl carrier protein
MSSITPAQGLYALGQILRQGVTGQIGVFAANWPVMGQNLPLLSESRLGSRLVNTSVALEKVAATRTDIVKSNEKERQVMVEKYLSESLARVFGLSSDKFDPGLSLYNLGLDSLTAVELKNRVETELLVVIPLEKLLQGPSVRQLGVEILEQLSKEYIYR